MAEYAVEKVRIEPGAFGKNPPYNGIEWRPHRDPQYHVYLYNLSRREFKQVGRIRMTIAAVEDDDPIEVVDSGSKKIVKGRDNERYHYVTSFPQPITMSKFDDTANMIVPVETDVIRFIIDQIQPDNISGRELLDEIRPELAWSVGNNYAEKGVFFSLTNPPMKEDVRKAVERMEKYYKRLLEQADNLQLTDKVKLSEALSGNPDYAYAADYYGKEVAWRNKQVRPEECKNCGEQKPVGRKFHVTSFGTVCIEPTLDGWQSAVKSGIKTYDQVPEELRWRKDPAPLPPVTK